MSEDETPSIMDEVRDLSHISPSLRHLAVPIDSVQEDSRNVRTHDEKNLGAIRASLAEFAQQKPIVVLDDGKTILAGNGTLRAAKALGWKTIARATFARRPGESDAAYMTRARAFAIADNRSAELAAWDDAALYEQLLELAEDGVDLDALLAFDSDDLAALLPGPEGEGGRKSLTESWGAPPFTVLDARQGYWRDRKKAWLSLGIESELGRAENLLKMSETVKEQTGWDGTSIFDPVLTEVLIRWFCPPDGLILDPFAGGSVRGVVASFLGRRYLGIELREEQVRANRDQMGAIESLPKDPMLGLAPGPRPEWKEGDSARILPTLGTGIADFVLSCPPYMDLERYSEEDGDLSAMEDNAFWEAYSAIIAQSVAALKPNRFAAFVVGEVRDEKGFYKGFVPGTITLFEKAGARFYNEAVLVTNAGSLPMRASRSFGSGRKLGKQHQNVLVFYKPGPKGKVVMPTLEVPAVADDAPVEEEED